MNSSTRGRTISSLSSQLVESNSESIDLGRGDSVSLRRYRAILGSLLSIPCRLLGSTTLVLLSLGHGLENVLGDPCCKVSFPLGWSITLSILTESIGADLCTWRGVVVGSIHQVAVVDIVAWGRSSSSAEDSSHSIHLLAENISLGARTNRRFEI